MYENDVAARSEKRRDASKMDVLEKTESQEEKTGTTEENEGAPVELMEMPEGVEDAPVLPALPPVTSEDDPFPPDAHARDAAPPEDVPRLRAGRYIVMFFCAVLALFAAAVVGTAVTGRIRSSGVYLPALLLRQVFPSGVTELPRTGGRPYFPDGPTVPRIPSDDPSDPGAMEEKEAEGGEADLPDTLPIRSVDVSSGERYGWSLINETPYGPDLEKTAARERAAPALPEIEKEYGQGAPAVLIIHTHGSEAYSPDGAETYGGDEQFRSLDPSETVAAVGDVMEAVLRERGIGVIHEKTMFDVTEFATAYDRAAAEIRRVIADEPSVSYVIDVHRDALITDAGECLRPVTETETGPAAQMMIVVGTDHAGSGHTGWEDNLSLALRIQRRIWERYPSLMRSVNLRSPSFNEQYTKGSLLLEVGAAGNSLNEAKRAAAIFAEALAEEIIGENGG
ncbi:MAG: stage II sporulation protein P [Clostridia bacterium]|nr:stage II sporulation protein P [Clostridia bacterium]